MQKEYFGCSGCRPGAGSAVRPAPGLCALPLPEVPRCTLLYAQRSRGTWPPPSVGRAGGVVRAARVTARSSHGASTGLSVTAPECAARTARRGPLALTKRCPRSLSPSQSSATDHPNPRPRSHLAAVNAETMDAGAAPQKHSRCRSCCCSHRAGAGRRAGAPLLLARVGAAPARGGGTCGSRAACGAQLLLFSIPARVRRWDLSRTGREVQGSLGGLRYWMRDQSATPCKLSSPGFRTMF